MTSSSPPSENLQERETREQGKFSEFESTMPLLPTRRHSASLGDKLSSNVFGMRNPFAKPVATTDEVWLFDNTAYQSSNGAGWEAEFVAAYFVRDSGDERSKMVADIAEKLGVGEGDEEEAIIAERLAPFMDRILPARTVGVEVDGGNAQKLGPSNRNGISSQIVTLSGDFFDGHRAKTKVVSLDADPMATHFAGPTGWAVISDIDDTIKKTLTSSPIGILQTTFVDEPEPIRGMPELYKHIADKMNPPFWYISASPYNLYTFLRDFRSKYYPPGTLILRDASWMNIAGFLISLTVGTMSYKVNRMSKVHEWFPNRKFILIGDSTQTDPEAYATMYKNYPGWVRGIYIRKVTGIPEIDHSQKNTETRFQNAFKDVPANIWHVFEDPKEIYEKVDQLVASEE